MTTRGCTKKIASASAMARCFSDEKDRSMAVIGRLARRVWRAGISARSPRNPAWRAAQGKVNRAPQGSRAQTICSTGMPFWLRALAMMSMLGRTAMAANIGPIPTRRAVNF